MIHRYSVRPDQEDQSERALELCGLYNDSRLEPNIQSGPEMVG